jgi:uncharacterized protein YdhG (YjbR/CyaY superfamily)
VKTTKPENIDAYIAGFPLDVQETLEQIRRAIKKAAPEAEEGISYKMPVFKTNGKPLVYFAAFKSHIGLYATPAAHTEFAKELSIYKKGKGSVQFPLNKPMHLNLIAEIVKFKVKVNLQQRKAKSQ